MAIMALQAFFENLSILHDIRECHEVSCSSASSCSSSSSLSYFIESDKGGEEGQVNNAIICLKIVCDNAVIPTNALLRKQRRKRQLQHVTERRRGQQHRPIYNRSISVNSFACSTSSRQQRLLKQSRAADNTLSLFSLEPASKRSSSPPPRSHEEELTTPRERHVHDLKAILIPRRISPASVMDVSLLRSPPTNSPKDLSNDSLQHCDTPKINNTTSKSEYYSTFLEHRKCVPSLMMEIPSMSPMMMTNNNNRGNEMVVTSKNISPRSARWSLLRQESDSALICPSRTRDLLFS
jgi:hypothetical protein